MKEKHLTKKSADKLKSNTFHFYIKQVNITCKDKFLIHI